MAPAWRNFKNIFFTICTWPNRPVGAKILSGFQIEGKTDVWISQVRRVKWHTISRYFERIMNWFLILLVPNVCNWKGNSTDETPPGVQSNLKTHKWNVIAFCFCFQMIQWWQGWCLLNISKFLPLQICETLITYWLKPNYTNLVKFFS